MLINVAYGQQENLQKSPDTLIKFAFSIYFSTPGETTESHYARHNTCTYNLFGHLKHPDQFTVATIKFIYILALKNLNIPIKFLTKAKLHSCNE